MIHNANEPLEDEAAHWAMRTLSGDLSPDERASLDVWLRNNPHGQKIFDELIEVADLAALAGHNEASQILERDLEAFASKPLSRRAWLLGVPAMAASIAGAAVFVSISSNVPNEPIKYATMRGENREIALEDGSRVFLNTNSKLTVLYTQDARNVEFDGEAVFDIERDPSRPFVISSTNARTRVLGTRFNVNAAPAQTVVSVLSGVVEVSPLSATSTTSIKPVTILAGQQVEVSNDENTLKVVDFDVDRVTAWQRGLVKVENRPLIDVVNELNRYYPAQIKLASRDLHSIPVTGGFDLTDQKSAIQALQIALSLEARVDNSGNIILEADDF